MSLFLLCYFGTFAEPCRDWRVPAGALFIAIYAPGGEAVQMTGENSGGAAGGAADGENRGPGRPRGSKNKKTEEFLALIKSQHGMTPGERLANIAFADPVELSREYGLTLSQAFDRMLKALVELMPYVHQKLPTMVDVVGERHIQLTIMQGFEGGQVADPDATPIIDARPANIRKIEEKQGLSDVPAEKSDTGQSDRGF